MKIRTEKLDDNTYVAFGTGQGVPLGAMGQGNTRDAARRDLVRYVKSERESREHDAREEDGLR